MTAQLGDIPVTIYASSTSGLPVTISSTTNTVCTVDSFGRVTFVSVGACELTANQAGNASFNPAAEVRHTITVSQTQTVTDNAPVVTNPISDVTVNTGAADSVIDLNGVFSDPDGDPITLSVAGNTNAALVTPTSLIGNGLLLAYAGGQSGTADITIRATANGQTVEDTFSVTVKAMQTVVFDAATPTSKTFGDAAFSVTATGGASGNAVVLDSSTVSVCTVSGNTVTLVATGTCTLIANQAGNANYSAASPVTHNITVTEHTGTPRPQVISVNPVDGMFVTNAPFTPVVSRGNSSSPLVFTSQTTTVCTVNSSTGVITLGRNAGTCSIKVEQAGNSAYRAAKPYYLRFSVSKLPQAITWTNAPPASAEVGTPFSIVATGGASGKPLKYSSLTRSTCTVSGNTVTPKAAGACRLQAEQEATASYAAAREQVTVTVN